MRTERKCRTLSRRVGLIHNAQFRFTVNYKSDRTLLRLLQRLWISNEALLTNEVAVIVIMSYSVLKKSNRTTSKVK
jgi:hypothetical protein